MLLDKIPVVFSVGGKNLIGLSRPDQIKNREFTDIFGSSVESGKMESEFFEGAEQSNCSPRFKVQTSVSGLEAGTSVEVLNVFSKDSGDSKELWARCKAPDGIVEVPMSYLAPA
jgi:hypothetical protein